MKISILTAVYNTARYLPECIESVLRQTHADWQLICVDDASGDGSWDILRRYAASDKRITLLRNSENRGQAYARNRGILEAEGDVIAMLDSDDYFADDALEKIAEMFESHPEADSVLFRCVYFDHTGRQWGFPTKVPGERFSGEEACRYSIDWRIHGIYAARRALYEKYPYDGSSAVFSDDNTTRLHYMKSREVWLSDAGYYYRQHDSSVTHRKDMRTLLIFLDALRNLRSTLLAEGLPEADARLIDEFRWRNLMGMYMVYYARRSQLTPAERAHALSTLRRHYDDIDTRHLPWLSVRLRFGYAPLKWCPPLYRLQLWAFTRLRLLLGMDKDRY